MRRIVFLVAVAALLCLGLSVGIGFAGAQARETFDWQLSALVATAAGTTLLAVATFWLAWSTRGDVRATQELAALTKRDQDLRQQPVIIFTNNGWSGSPQAGRVGVELVNVGSGPALRVRVNARYADPEHQPQIDEKKIRALLPNQVLPIAVETRFWEPYPPGGARTDGFLVMGSYIDRAGNDYIIMDPEDPHSLQPF